MRCRTLRLAVALIMAAGPATFAVDIWDEADSKWRLGPVKYLLTKEEDQEYKKLKTDEQRRAFVDTFWARRDPDPATPENEYRDTFYQRAREAAARFTEEGGKGWQDDRGRVYLLLGPPDETSQGTSLLESTTGGFDASGPPGSQPGGAGDEGRPAPQKTVKFIYRTNPLTGKDRLELNFRSEVTGGYALDEKIDWQQAALKGLAPRAKGASPAAGGASAPPAPPAPGAPGGAQVPPSVQPEAPPSAAEVTPQSDLMQQVRSAADVAGTVPLDVIPNFYKASKGTLATLTLEVKRSSLPSGTDPASLVLAAEIVNTETGESVQRFFKQEHFGGYEGNTDPNSGDILLFQAQRPVNPGKYKAFFALKDPVSAAIGKLEKEIVVPDYESGGMSLSTVTLTRKLEPLVSPPPADKLTPFVLGNFQVVPRPDNIYKQGEEATFYYQIYNPTTDPNTRAPKLELAYTFEVNVGGQWRMLGGRPLLFPGQSLLVNAYTLPLANRPSGDYRITIKVTDTLATPPAVATERIEFKLLGAPPSKAKAKSKG